MANGRGRSVAPARKLVAIALATCGVFVALFGLGLWSPTVVALGVAMVVLAIALILVSAFGSGARAWVAGTGHVVSASEPPANSTYGRCEMQLVVDAPGLPAAAVRVRDPRVPVAKWPDAGSAVPIIVAIGDPRRVRIQWDDMPTHAEAAEAAAAAEDERYDEAEADRIADELVAATDDATRVDEVPPPATMATGPAPAGVATEAGGAEPIPTPGGPAREPGSVPRPRRPQPRPRRSGPPPSGPDASTAASGSDSGVPGPAAATGTALADPPLAAAPPAPGPLAAAPTATGPSYGFGITVLVTDLARSIAFYRDMLGFFEIDGGDGNAVLACGETRLVLRAVEGVAPVNRRLVHVNLEVGDLDAVYGELRSKGVRFTYGPRPVNSGARLEQWAAAFRDPDGHGIALTQWRERPGS